MADSISNAQTSLPPEEVIVRAVQFFSTESWRATSQSPRTVTFQGKPPIPWFMLLLTVLAFLACIVPGVVMYVLVIRKTYRFYNLVVSVTAMSNCTEVVIQHPRFASRLVHRFIDALPPRATV